MKVFVSAASADLGECREAVKDVLLQGDIQPVTQEVLRADHRNLPEFLDALVQSCDAVICLVGEAFGAAPEDEPHRSYTQREYDCATRLRKPIFVFLASEAFYSSGAPQQSPQQAEWQREHRQSLMREKYCRTFGTPGELQKEVGVSLWSIRRSAGRIPLRYYHLPAAPPFFVGRTDEKAQLLKAMAARSPSVVAVIGMAGQGKSALVHHVLDARQEDVAFPFQAGFWWTADQGLAFDLFLDEAMDCLTEGKFDKTRAPGTRQRVQCLLGQMQERPVLIVIDATERWLRGWEATGADGGAITEEDRSAAFDGLDGFLAQATALRNGSHLIVTSRAMPQALEDVDVSVVPVRKPTDYDIGLQGLAPADAVAMLRSYDLQADDERLGRIGGQLGFHPLALRVFGGYVKKYYGGALDKAAKLHAWDPKKTLRKLFDDVYQRLPGGAESRRFVEAASCTIEDAPLEAFEAALKPADAAADDADLRDTAVKLADWQVITFESRTGTVGMHALLKEHFGRRLSPSDRAGLHQRFAHWYDEQPIARDPTALTDVKARLLTFQHALCAGDLERCEQTMWGPVTPLYSLVQWMGALGHFAYGAELLAGLAAAASGGMRARARIARAALLRPIGRHGEAREDLDEAIAILEGGAEPRSPADVFDLAGALSNRGTVFLELAQYSPAIADFDRAIDLLRDSAGDASGALQLAAVRANRAMLLREIGRLRDSIADCAAAIEARRTCLDPVSQQIDADLASAHVNRGNAYHDLRCHEEALRDYDAARAIHATLVQLGQPQFRQELALGAILRASVLGQMDRHDEAIPELDRAAAAYRELIRAGKTHLEPMLAFAQMRRAWSLAAIGRAAEAVGESEAAREIYARLVRAGRRDMEGPCAHATFIGAVVRGRAGDQPAAQASWQEAMELARRLVESGESDLRLLVVRYSFERALDLVDSDPDHAARLVTAALAMAEPVMHSDEPTEGLEAEVRHAICLLQGAKAQERLALDWASIAALKKWLDAKATDAHG